MSKETQPCPNCGRPIGFEYSHVEAGKCQLWRVISEGFNHFETRTVVDCFAHTSRRVRELQAKVADLVASKSAAQRRADLVVATMRTTRTYAILEVSQATYDEIRAAFVLAGYNHAITRSSMRRDDGEELLDMNGVALAVNKDPKE